jgi:Inner membrane protein YgaP-like, transmembrane domain
LAFSPSGPGELPYLYLRIFEYPYYHVFSGPGFAGNLAAFRTLPGGKQMSVERGTLAFAGFMVLLSVALTAWVHPQFVWLTVFVGANLVQSAFTGFCPASMVMHKLGVRTEREQAQLNS